MLISKIRSDVSGSGNKLNQMEWIFFLFSISLTVDSLTEEEKATLNGSFDEEWTEKRVEYNRRA